MSPAPSFFHQKIVARFYKVAGRLGRRSTGWGKTALAPIDMVLTTRRATQPDVVFISNEHLGIIKERIMGAADLVAEVISPGSRRRDRIDKRDLYEQHGVHEYWLIDPKPRRSKSSGLGIRHLPTGWPLASRRAGPLPPAQRLRGPRIPALRRGLSRRGPPARSPDGFH